jgi:hypothetical protein
MEIRLIPRLDGAVFSMRELLSQEEWPSQAVTIKPVKTDLFYMPVCAQSQAVILLFTRSLHTYERMLNRLRAMLGHLPCYPELHMSLVIASSAQLQAISSAGATKYVLPTPLEYFRAFLRGRTRCSPPRPKPPSLVRIIWSRDWPETVYEAKEKFKELTESGWRALSIQLRPIHEFPLDDEEVVLARPRPKDPEPEGPKPSFSELYQQIKQPISDSPSLPELYQRMKQIEPVTYYISS